MRKECVETSVILMPQSRAAAFKTSEMNSLEHVQPSISIISGWPSSHFFAFSRIDLSSTYAETTHRSVPER